MKNSDGFEPTFVNGVMVNDRRKKETRSKLDPSVSDELGDALRRIKDRDQTIKWQQDELEEQSREIRVLRSQLRKFMSTKRLVERLDEYHAQLKDRLDQITLLRNKAKRAVKKEKN
jgi:hypothetical protein